jgi:hypothetical protein
MICQLRTSPCTREVYKNIEVAEKPSFQDYEGNNMYGSRLTAVNFVKRILYPIYIAILYMVIIISLFHFIIIALLQISVIMIQVFSSSCYCNL